MQRTLTTSAAAPRPMGELAGKAAIVTGSTSGIGRGIAHAFAKMGMHVMLNGIGKATEIERIRNEFAAEFGVGVAYSSADMTKPTDIEQMMADAVSSFGTVDVLVNNAGIFHVESVEATPPAKWDSSIAINLTAAFHTIRAVLPAMKVRRWGRVINIASALGLAGQANASAYAASKHGIVGLTRTVALEVAEHGITVNAICPGYVLTPLVEREIRATAEKRGVAEEQVKSEFLAQSQPTKRFVTPGEIGAFAAFLCTDAAASITGATLPIDGGWTAR